MIRGAVGLKSGDDIPMTLYDDVMQHRCRLRPAEEYVLDHGYRINVTDERPFSYLDFPKYKHGTIRNVFSSLARKGLIYRVYRSTIAFYAVRGTGIRADSIPKVTRNPMGVSLLLQSLPVDDDSVHDVRLVFDCDGLYGGLISVGWRADPSNGDVALKPLRFEGGRVCRVIVHASGRVTVIVDCSGSPFRLADGLYDLFLILDRVRYCLEHEYLPQPVRVPPIGSWVVVQWHHGVDGSMEFSGKSFNLTFYDWSNTLIRFYARKTPTGYRLRLERVESPGRPLRDLLMDMLSRGG